MLNNSHLKVKIYIHFILDLKSSWDVIRDQCLMFEKTANQEKRQQMELFISQILKQSDENIDMAQECSQTIGNKHQPDEAQIVIV